MCSPRVMDVVRQELAGGATASRRSFVAAAAALPVAIGFSSGAVRARQATPVGSPPVLPARQAIVDLTHTMTPEMPIWPGEEPFAAEVIRSFETDGFYAQRVSFGEHTGTHVDAPAHFVDGGDTAELIDAGTLFAPICVIDIASRAEEDPDTALTVDDLMAYEAMYGEIPAGALVAMYSGWGSKIEDAEAFVNLDAEGVQHYPGFHPDAAEFLTTQRDIVGIAVDTLSQDPGNSVDFGTHITILGAGKYGVEAIANLDLIDPAGASVFVGAPKHLAASGGPARIIGLNRAR